MTSSSADRQIVRRQRLLRWTSAGLLPGAVLVLLIAVWQAITVIFHTPDYFIPSPGLVASTIWTERSTILSNMVPTITEAAGGFALGSTVALLLAVWFVHFRTAERALYPLAIATQSIPLVAVAPILIVTLGTGYSSKVAMAAIISFFPTLVNTVRGLEAVEPPLLDLFQSVHASAWKVLLKLRLPNALPYIFVAFRITATTSVIGAIIAEWIGAEQGLGYLVINSTYEFNTPLLWATLVASSFLALAAFLLMAFLERLLVPWRASAARKP